MFPVRERRPPTTARRRYPPIMPSSSRFADAAVEIRSSSRYIFNPAIDLSGDATARALVMAQPSRSATFPVLKDRIIQPQFAIAHQLHHSSGDDLLTHHRESEDRIARHRSLEFEVERRGGYRAAPSTRTVRRFIAHYRLNLPRLGLNLQNAGPGSVLFCGHCANTRHIAPCGEGVLTARPRSSVSPTGPPCRASIPQSASADRSHFHFQYWRDNEKASIMRGIDHGQLSSCPNELHSG